MTIKEMCVWLYYRIKKSIAWTQNDRLLIKNEFGYYNTGPSAEEASHLSGRKIHDLVVFVVFEEPTLHPKIVKTTDNRGATVDLHLQRSRRVTMPIGDLHVAQIDKVTPADQPDKVLNVVHLNPRVNTEFKFGIGGNAHGSMEI